MGKITAPVPLGVFHDVATFSGGNVTLDDWLKKRALKNEGSGASRTFVVCEKKRVVGYYTLATGAVAQREVPGKIRRNMPEPILIILLGRLAVDSRWQNQHLGEDLLQDAIKRVLNASLDVGIKAILVHAISDKAKNFYLKRGFLESKINGMTLILPLATSSYHLN